MVSSYERSLRIKALRLCLDQAVMREKQTLRIGRLAQYKANGVQDIRASTPRKNKNWSLDRPLHGALGGSGCEDFDRGKFEDEAGTGGGVVLDT